jgi:hypothetical protein
MAKKKTWTKEQVLADWLGPLKDKLGSKKLAPIIHTTFEPLLLANIQKKLDDKKNDYNADRANARAVARAVGKFCKELTGGSEVQLGVFQSVFKTCQLHHKCPGGGGSGKWCDI